MGRPAALDEDRAADVVDAYAKGAAVKALARRYDVGRYDVAPKTIRRVLDAAGARDAGGVLACRSPRASTVMGPGQWKPVMHSRACGNSSAGLAHKPEV